MAFLVSLPVLYERMRWEKQNNRVLMIVDFDEYLVLCRSSALSVEDCARFLLDRGLALAISELTLRDRVESGEVQVSRDSEALVLRVGLKLEPDFALAYPDEWRTDPGIPEWRFPVGASLDDLPGGFAIPEAKRRQISSLWVLRPRARPYWNREQIRAFSNKMSHQSSVPLMLSAGEEVLGFPYAYREAAEGFTIVAFPEFSQQRGANALAQANPDKAMRLHTIPHEEWSRYSLEGARARFLRATRERSVRLLYLHAVPNRSLEENLRFLDDLIADLKSAGFELGPPFLQAPPENPFARLLFGLCVVVFLLTTASFSLWAGFSYFVSFSCSAFFCVLTLLSGPSTFSAISLALVIGLAFGVTRGPPFTRWLWLVLVAVVSGVIVAATVQTPALLKGIFAVSGVRFSLLIPLVAAFFFSYHPNPREWGRALRMRSPSYLDALSALIFVAFTGYALLRAGTMQGWEFPLESRLRGFLEHHLLVRPRFKEILGHPLLIAVPAIARKEALSTAFLIGLGALAPASIFNSFFHLHTPLALTFYRIGLGVILGFALGFPLLLLTKRYEGALRRLLW